MSVFPLNVGPDATPESFEQEARSKLPEELGGPPRRRAIGRVLTDPLESGDRGLDDAYGRLAAAVAAVKGRTRVLKVQASDLRLIVSQFRVMVDRAKEESR